MLHLLSLMSLMSLLGLLSLLSGPLCTFLDCCNRLHTVSLCLTHMGKSLGKAGDLEGPERVEAPEPEATGASSQPLKGRSGAPTRFLPLAWSCYGSL